jgi:hypothetical protein
MSTLTVKTPVQGGPGIDVRTTCEVRLIGQLSLITVIAKFLGFTASCTLKVRETWQLPNGALVEIDSREEFFWLEVEAATEALVLESVFDLGYDESDMWAITEERALKYFRGEKDLPASAATP